jgi:hypothetical protein
MAAPTPTTEPLSLLAGDTAKWLITLADYSAADGWALTYALVSATNRITFSASASGTDFLVNVAATTTTTWAAGTYSWRSQVTKAGEIYTVATGTITVQPSFGAATDARSHARKTLDAVQTYLEDANNLNASRYMIAGRELWRISITELLVLRSRYQMEVAREEAATSVGRGLPDKRRVLVRFN